MKYEVKINYEVDVKEVLDIASEIVAKNAVLRIRDKEVEPLHRYLPAETNFVSKSEKNEDDIAVQMFNDRGGDSANALDDTGALLSSLEPYSIGKQISGDTLGVTSHLSYAKDHQFGGLTVVNSSKLSEWENKYDVEFLKEVTVNIFPRYFVQFGDRELQELLTVLQAIYKRRLS